MADFESISIPRSQAAPLTVFDSFPHRATIRMPPPTLSVLFLFSACLFLHHVCGTAYESQHVLPSGRRIPLAAILAHPYGAQGADIIARLYELSDKHVLSNGRNESVALHAQTRTHQVHYHPNLQVSLNGLSAPHAASPGVVREGAGFSAAYLHGEERPTDVVVRGVQLMPLHFGRHPGVYIAAPASQSAQADGEASKEEEGADETMASAVRQTGGQRRWCGPNAAKRSYEIAAAFDNSLCALYDDDFTRVLFRIQLAVGWADKAFTQYLCMRTALVYVEAHCRDPNDPVRKWPRTTRQNLLPRFQNFWQKSRAYVQRDIAILFSSVSGSSFYEDSSCSKKIGYAVSEVNSKAIAYTLAGSLGARRASSGLMSGIGVFSSIKLSAASATLVRNFLEFNGKAWCVTVQRRLCSAANCKGRCVRGACVAGKLYVPQKCAATTKGNWNLECVPYRKLTDVVIPGNIIRARYALQFGRLYVQFEKVNRVSLLYLPAVMAYVKLGSRPRLTEGELDLTSTLTFSFNIADLPNARPGKSCCGQKLYFSARVLYCATFRLSCTTKTLQFTWNLPCKGICNSPGGAPLPMGLSRKCPVCKRG